MNPLVEKALFGAAIPATLALLFTSAALWRQWRGHACRRLAAWAAPLAGAAALAISYQVQFSGTSERWQWIVPTSIALLLLWPLSLMPWPRRSWSTALLAVTAGLLLGSAAGLLMWPSFYDSQPAWLRAVPFVAVGLAVVGLLPIAVGDARPADALALTLAGGLLVPIVVFSGNERVGWLLMPVIVASGLAALLALVVPGARFGQWRQGTAAGALGVALVMPPVALLAWGNSYDLEASMAWALALPCLAIPLVWLGRAPWLRRRPLTAAALVVLGAGLVAGAGLAIALAQTDTAAYEPPF